MHSSISYTLHFKVQVNAKLTCTGPRNVDAKVLIYVLHGVTGSAHVQGRKGAYNVSDSKARMPFVEHKTTWHVAATHRW